ncbi:Transmembrane protease serine 11D [Platysternon megacephalum]|uniref:Transmembrane protease serine 11D n=1 Tax=Platysternon megacephalum TaxID=55544 RepID=A0A4D9E6E5_9SAUR|nr:Transmembrane protease serine 11D [Platysternon megacephalum]
MVKLRVARSLDRTEGLLSQHPELEPRQAFCAVSQETDEWEFSSLASVDFKSDCKSSQEQFRIRLTQLDTRMKLLEPWKLALIVLAVVLFMALVIGLLVYFLLFDQDMYFYNGTFKITNVQYNREFDKHTSKEFRDLSTSIEMLVTNTFRASVLNKKYVRSHVVNLRDEEGKWRTPFQQL